MAWKKFANALAIKNGAKRKRRFYKRRKNFKSFFNRTIGFPKTAFVKMRYVDTITLSPSVNTLNEEVFKANGIFDPYYPLGGHQPLGRDQWALFYNKYVVYRSECSVKFCVRVNNSEPLGIGIYLSSSPTTTALNVNTLQEQGHSVSLIGSPTTNGNAFTLNNKLKMSYNAKKWHGVTNVKDADNLEADFSADPADGTYFIVFAGPMDPTAAAPMPSVVVNVTIDYYVLCKDVKELPLS